MKELLKKDVFPKLESAKSKKDFTSLSDELTSKACGLVLEAGITGKDRNSIEQAFIEPSLGVLYDIHKEVIEKTSISTNEIEAIRMKLLFSGRKMWTLNKNLLANTYVHLIPCLLILLTAPTPHASVQGSSSSADYRKMSLSELRARKKKVKGQLKLYDMNFARRHGRMPLKSEKELIRHLYGNYHALRSQIQMAVQEGQRPPPAVVQTRASPRSMSAPLAVLPRPDSSSDDGSPPPPTSQSRVCPMQKALRAEKRRLYRIIRSYEKDFFRKHGRHVSNFAEVEPLARLYRRYKYIKEAIATY